MENQFKKTPSKGMGLRSARENLPRKAKDTPINASHQNDKAEEGIQGELIFPFVANSYHSKH